MSWKDSFVGDTNYVEREIKGQIVKFYPVSVKVMFGLRRVAKPLAKALGVLFAQTGKKTSPANLQDNIDVGINARFEGKDGVNETTWAPIDPALAKLRADQVANSIAEVVDALTDPANGKLIGDMIVDSCREIFPRGSSRPTGDQVFNELDGPTLKDYLKGLMEANKSVLGPLGETVQQKVLDGGKAVVNLVEQTTVG